MKTRSLRVIGTSATLTEEIRRQAAIDLPFEINFEILDGVSCLRRGVMMPESYDVYDQWFHSVDLLWTAGAIQPIDTKRIFRWPEVRIAGQPVGASLGKGRNLAPQDRLYIQDDGTLGPKQSSLSSPLISMLPTTYNMDSFAYTRELSAELKDGELPSWAWLIDDRWHGRCTLSLDPASSVVELALAVRSAGLVDIENPADLTIEEIDALFEVLMSRKRTGHFTRLWASTEDSARILAGTSCVIGSIWSPAFYTLRGMGQDVVYAAPVEGYRGWHAGLCLSARIDDHTKDLAYAYLNWWLDGTPGAIMARQGYYISVVEPLRATMSPAEWGYWYGGEQSTERLPGSSGVTVVQPGELREGGSYLQRVSNVSVWSNIMSEQNYLERRWREFLDA